MGKWRFCLISVDKIGARRRCLDNAGEWEHFENFLEAKKVKHELEERFPEMTYYLKMIKAERSKT